MIQKIKDSDYDSSDFLKMTNKELMFALRSTIKEIIQMCAGNKLSEVFARIFMEKMFEEIEKRIGE